MGNDHPATGRRKSGIRARRILLAILAVGLLFAAGYAASPALISAASPLVAERLGLESLHIAAERPTLNRIVIREFDAANAAVAASGRGVTIEYTLTGLWRGVVEDITADHLSVTVLPDPGSTEEAEASPPGIPELPLDRLVVRELSLHVPAAGFTGAGSAALSADGLDVDLNGLAPEAASRFSLRAGIDAQGTYSAQFFDREQPDGPFVAVVGSPLEQAITIDATLDLRGYAFELASSLLRLPEGQGSIRGRIVTELPWPVPDALDWEDLSAEVDAVALEWRSASSPLAIESMESRATITDGSINGSVRGEVTHSVAGADIRISIPEDLSFNYARDAMRSEEGSARVSMSRDGDSLDAVIRSLSVEIDEAPGIQAIADLETMTGGARTSGELRIGMEIESLTEPALQGVIDLDATTEIAGTEWPIALSADIGYIRDGLSISGTASSGALAEVPLTISHDVEDNRGSARFRHTMRLDGPLAGTLLADWHDDYDLTGGTLGAEGEIRWAEAEAVTAQLEIDLTNGAGFQGETTATGITTKLAISWDDVTTPLEWRLQPASIGISAINVGFPITDVTIPVARSRRELSLRSSTAEILGGTLTIAPFLYDPDTGTAELDVRLADISLAELLALEGEDITGSGRIDAVIPVRLLDNTPRVEGGTFEAQPPGGTIAIGSSFAPQSGQPGLDFALRALTDFRFTGLSGNVDYNEHGDLKLAIRLDGNNPAIEQGRAIRYNLTISENIPTLLESLRLSERFTERLQEGVND